jgi:hypothetical protein
LRFSIAAGGIDVLPEVIVELCWAP